MERSLRAKVASGARITPAEAAWLFREADDALLQELGYGAAEIARLKADGAV